MNTSKEFGDFTLLRSLGASQKQLLWEAVEHPSERPVLVWIDLSRRNPAQQQAWLSSCKASQVQAGSPIRAQRYGIQAGWAYLCFEPNQLTDAYGVCRERSLSAVEIAQFMLGLARQLAALHRLGGAHSDLQDFNCMLTANLQPVLLGYLIPPDSQQAESTIKLEQTHDLVSLGLLLHFFLSDQRPFELKNLQQARVRLPPEGAEYLRLPFELKRQVPQALRIITNRCTDKVVRRRYSSADDLVFALDGWLSWQAGEHGGLRQKLIGAVGAHGIAPCMLSREQRSQLGRAISGGQLQEVADLACEDLTLTLSILTEAARLARQATRLDDDGDVLLSLKRAVTLLGADRTQRLVNGLADAAKASPTMGRLARKLKRQRRLAIALAPAGYAEEVTSLVVGLQSISAMACAQHCDAQTASLMAIANESDFHADPGLTGQQQAFTSVFGVDPFELNDALLESLGFSPRFRALAHPVAMDELDPRVPDDFHVLRATASCAIFAVESLQSKQAVGQVIKLIVQRFGKLLGLNSQMLQEALLKLAKETAERDAEIELQGSRQAVTLA